MIGILELECARQIRNCLPNKDVLAKVEFAKTETCSPFFEILRMPLAGSCPLKIGTDDDSTSKIRLKLEKEKSRGSDSCSPFVESKISEQ